jgi:hypothetical protein
MLYAMAIALLCGLHVAFMLQLALIDFQRFSLALG